MSSSQGRTAAANEDHHAGGNHGKDLPDDEENVDTNTTTHNDEPSADKVEVSTEKEAGTLVQQNETADGVDSEDASSRDDSDDDSSSSSSDDSEDGQKLTLMEIREQKMKRNQELLESLGLTKQFLVKKRPPSRTRKSVSNKEEEGEEPAIPRRPRGMLLSVPNGSIPRVSVATSVRLDKETSTESDLTSGERRNAALDALYDRYPHRESQIHRLVGILGAACDCKEAYYIPPPVFLSGPSGTAKTSIARDVLTALCQPTFAGDGERVVAGAYVNCNSLDSLSIEEIVRNAYSQFEEQIVTKHSKKKRKHGGVSLQSKCSLCISVAP